MGDEPRAATAGDDGRSKVTKENHAGLIIQPCDWSHKPAFSRQQSARRLFRFSLKPDD
jgi:hypothetical protein